MKKRNPNSVTGTVMGVMAVLLALSGVLIAALATGPAGALNVPKGYRVARYELRDFAITGPTTLPHGNYEIVITNHGTVPHELVMWSTKARAAALPLRKDATVDEESSSLEGVVDSGSSLAPGETRILFGDLTSPGHYALVCNLPAHYRAGMHLDLDVTR
jgi:uncharacterized cupredoxin-like copper-binding protein